MDFENKEQEEKEMLKDKAAEENKKECQNENKEQEEKEVNEIPKIMSEPDESGKRYFNVNQAAQMPVKKAKILGMPRGVAIFLIIVLIVALLIGFGTVSCSTTFTSKSNVTTWDTPNSDYIAEIYVEGTIQSGNTGYFGEAVGYQHQWTLDTIDMLMHDDNNKGLLIYVDSPGGGVYESDELYLKILDYQALKKPVYVYMGSMAASGGYYISAPADKIIANRNCWTGSIGVTIGTMMDLSGLLERYGVETVTIDSGAYKSMGSSYRHMSQGEKDIWQSLVDEAYLQFVEIVAEGRGLDLEETKKIADGRIYSAYQALELGLIDEIMGYEEALELVQGELYADEIVSLYPDSSYNIWSFLSMSVDKIQKAASGELGALSDMIEKNAEVPTLKYVYQ